MAAFPTLSRPPVYGLEHEFEDDIIRDPYENGDEATRPRYTRIRKQWGNLKYEQMLQADVTAVDDHYKAHRGSIFPWTHPVTGVTYNVRYASPPKATYPSYAGYDITVALKEA